MKRFLPLACLLIGLAYIAVGLRPPANQTGFDLNTFGRIPILVNGRIKPLDTVARTTLLTIQGRQRVSTPEKSEPLAPSPRAWLADVLFNPAKSDDYPTFRIDSPEVLALMGITEEETKIQYESAAKRVMALIGFLPSTHTRFSYNRLRAKMPELDRQARMADEVETAVRTPFQRHAVLLRDRVVLYLQLKTSVQVPDATDFLSELVLFQQALPAGISAVLARQKGETYNEAALATMKEMADRFTYMEQLGYLNCIPPAKDDANPQNWRKAGTVLLDSFGTGRVDPTVMAYAALGHAWRTGSNYRLCFAAANDHFLTRLFGVNADAMGSAWGASDPDQFNQVVGIFHTQLEQRYAAALKKSDVEARFNAAEPFYRSMTLYVWAFLFAVVSWLKWPDLLGRSAFWFLAVAWVTSTLGIITRMWLESRPPVTNLYSSALFVGWGAVLLCLVLERVYKNGVGTVAGGMVGFVTLLIAHHLSLSGDTLEMMRAVLDTNIWLATHVVVVTLGYASTFLAGFLALIYIVRGVFTKSLDPQTADALTRMVYGIVCFATLFSLVGTVLGGIWADQSWGRFWGWDPKENGALLIVVWNAIILHARWGGMVKQRGLMSLAIFGNIVTSWSWFGTNMLGVGLHSYGFMDAAFWWLIAFVASQLAVIALASLPLDKWRSFRPTAS